MKHLLRYIPLLFISFLTYCTTTEEGLDRAEVMQLSTGSIEAEALGGENTFYITSRCAWEAKTSYESDDTGWIELSDDADEGSTEITVTLSENTSAKDRYATIEVGNARYNLTSAIQVHQKGKTVALVCQSELHIGVGATTSTIPVDATIEYQVTDNADWLEYTIVTGGIEVSATTNTSDEQREAQITLYNSEYGLSHNIVVKQDYVAHKIIYTSMDGIVTPSDHSVAQIVKNVMYDDGIGIIQFNSPVTTIGCGAFKECLSLKSIIIPDSVTTIDLEAFYGCMLLSSVIIGDNVTEIGDNAFDCCESLKSVTIPDSVTSIGSEAFSGCDSLLSVTIGDNVTYIGEQAFSFCKALTSVTIPDNVIGIESGTFMCCFALKNVTIGDSVTTIGDYAFNSCSSLTSVTIPDSVTTIGEEAFYDCYGLTSVTIGDSVTSIGNYAFYDCTSLTSVYCKATTPPSLGEDAFKWDGYGSDGSWNLVNIECTIYVPTASVEAYKSAEYWSDYASDIVGYDFETGEVVE